MSREAYVYTNVVVLGQILNTQYIEVCSNTRDYRKSRVFRDALVCGDVKICGKVKLLQKSCAL
ncbi:hypothetical protein BM1374166_01539 [Bartonella tribocorum]|nr:hypothetical protein BM1374166_01539 [Bartonella tribocorum]